MTITVYRITPTADGAGAVISLEIRSGEETQKIKGKVSASQLSDLGFASRMDRMFEIDRVTCDAVLRCMKLHAAIEKGLDLLNFAQNSKKTLKNKLKQRGFPAEIAEEAAEYLSERGLIRENDDAQRFAEMLATRKLYGKSRIQKELYAKGFSGDVICEVLDGLDVDFSEICAKRMEKMGGKALFEDKDTKQKTIAALMRYGFTFDHIKEALTYLE